MDRIINPEPPLVRSFSVRTGIGAFLVLLLASAAPVIAETEAAFPDVEGQYLGRYLESVSEGDLLGVVAHHRGWWGSAVEKTLSGHFSTDRIYRATFGRTDGNYTLRLDARDDSDSVVYEWGINDLLAHESELTFISHDRSAPFADFRNHARWYRLDVINETSHSVRALLELDKHFLSWFDLYLMKEAGLEGQVASFETPLEERLVADDRIVHPLLLPPGSTRLYVRLEGAWVDTVPIRLWTPEGFQQNRIRKSFISGCVFSATIAMAIYALIAFLSLGEPGYLYLCVAIVLGLASHSAMSGLGFAFFWPGRPDLSAVFFYIFHPLATVANLLFCRSLLGSSFRIPLLDRWLLCFLFSAALLALAQITGLVLRIERLGPVLSGVSVILDLVSLGILFVGILAVGGRRRRRRGFSERLLALALGFGVLSYLEFVVSSMDILPLKMLDFLQVRTLGFALVTLIAMAVKTRTARSEIQRMRGEITEMLHTRALSDGKKNLTDETAGKVEIVQNYIDVNFTDVLIRSDLASSVDLSPDHLGRMFKKLTGETIANYITARRITEAKRRLADCETKVTDIAFDVGFDSLRTFNKAFLALTGMSPSSYRKRFSSS